MVIASKRASSKVAGGAALAMLLLFVVNMTTWMAALDWDARAADPDIFLSRVVHHVGLWRFSLTADFFSYVAMVPIVIVLWQRSGRRGPADLCATVSGLAFAAAGGAAAISMLGLWSRLFVLHPSSMDAALFRASWYVLPRAIWNCFDAFALGIWLVWAGGRAYTSSKRLRTLSFTAGGLGLAESFLFMAGLEPASEVVQVVYGFVLFFWLAAVAWSELT